jgi:hypothetical protein
VLKKDANAEPITVVLTPGEVDTVIQMLKATEKAQAMTMALDLES